LRDPADDRDDEPRGVGARNAAGVTPRGGALAEQRWSIIAGVCLIVAAALWWFVGVDAAFVVATFGVLAWFWDQRNRLSANFIEDDARADGRRGDDEDFDDEDGRRTGEHRVD